jgi:hypothetical protein
VIANPKPLDIDFVPLDVSGFDSLVVGALDPALDSSTK